jgi:hypothetical protein
VVVLADAGGAAYDAEAFMSALPAPRRAVVSASKEVPPCLVKISQRLLLDDLRSDS